MAGKNKEAEILTESESQMLARLLVKMREQVEEEGRVFLNVFRALWENTVMVGQDVYRSYIYEFRNDDP